jgi:hypothetical protein
VTLASGQLNPGMLEVVGAYVYWTNRGDSTGQGGAVMKLPVAGGSAIPVASSQNKAFGLALNASNVYWSSASAGGTIQSLPLSGGSAAAVVGAANSPVIAVNSTSLFFHDCPTENTWCAAVRRMPLSGGASQSIGTGTIQGFLALNSAYLYWATPTTLYRVPLNGGTSTAIVSGQSNINGIAADESNLFFTNLTNGGNIQKANLDGTGAVELATGPGAPNSLTADATTVYWTENGIGNTTPSVLSMVPRAGGASKTLYSISRASVGMCGVPKTDDKAIYWLVTGSELNATGSIMKLAKP